MNWKIKELSLSRKQTSGAFSKKHLLRLLTYQREYWRKRCTIRWIQFGYERPSLFQALATERYRNNTIATLMLPEGTEIEDHAGKEEIIYNTFKERLGHLETFK